MPLINDENGDEFPFSPTKQSSSPPPSYSPFSLGGRQTQHSLVAKSVLMHKLSKLSTLPTNELSTNQQLSPSDPALPVRTAESQLRPSTDLAPPVRAATKTSDERSDSGQDLKPVPYAPNQARHNPRLAKDGVGHALSDTPLPSIPPSPKIPPLLRSNSAASTPRIRPTTLDIPGLTKSKVSPDGRIAQRDIGSKLVIVMVGLPARGKSYITKKVARYLNWLQHDTRIFNVGERRRIAASGHKQTNTPPIKISTSESDAPQPLSDPQRMAQILVNGQATSEGFDSLHLPEPAHPERYDAKHDSVLSESAEKDDVKGMDQSAYFFDPDNKTAARIREQAAMETLDELLDFIMGGGAVGIFDATNSTLARRKFVMDHIRKRAGPELNVLFLESMCVDGNLLESNMRLKLSGPDYKDKDPVAALADFRRRVALYEKSYVPLGDYEEKNHMPYVQMIDVGRKVISHQIKGFLSSQTVYYLLNFNLAPRMIWITRHGESNDNVSGRIGGDADLSENGKRYSMAMARFIEFQRKEWEVHQQDKAMNTHFPPHPGDHTPPNPHYSSGDEPDHKNFCVWTSMLKRSIQSAECFNEEDVYEVKQMRMLNELYAGEMEGMTYEEIRRKYEHEYEIRQQDKMGYRYPGPGGEGYLDVINRLRPVIVELERMTDHVLLVTHRSVARVLLAYFRGLRRDEVADLDCPLGMLYMLEPKPYGVEFKAFCYNSSTDWFDELPNFKLHRASTKAQIVQ